MASRQRIAYHEAGHAVVAWALEYPIVSVTIVPESDADGRAILNIQGHVPDTELIIIALAGEVAERLRFKRLDLVDALGSVEDERLYLGITSNLLPQAQTRYLRFCRGEARTLLKQHWNRVETLAATLLRDGTVTGNLPE